MDLALNNLQRLICHRTQTNKHTHTIYIYIYIYIYTHTHTHTHIKLTKRPNLFMLKNKNEKLTW